MAGIFDNPTDPVLDSVFPGGFAAGAVELNR
jgi:hypothetical protein